MRMANNSFLKGGSVKALQVGEADMTLINRFALEPLSKEEVYTFEVAACGNDIDRDFERIEDDALHAMADLFVGKTVVSDHRHSTKNQIARVYAAEVEDGGETSDGRPKKTLVLRCYMLANEANAPVIADIKAGIKREVSVCFSAASAVCSICGTDRRKTRGQCFHWPGRDYDGKVCHMALGEVRDCYELSFVAVPAQKDAGVRKDYFIDGDDPDDGGEAPSGGGGAAASAPEQSKSGNEEPAGSFFMAKRKRLAEALLTIKEED